MRVYANMLHETQQKDKNNANDEVHKKSNTSRARKRGKLDAIHLFFKKLGHASGLENHSFFLNFVLYIASPFHFYERTKRNNPR